MFTLFLWVCSYLHGWSDAAYSPFTSHIANDQICRSVNYLAYDDDTGKIYGGNPTDIFVYIQTKKE